MAESTLALAEPTLQPANPPVSAETTGFSPSHPGTANLKPFDSETAKAARLAQLAKARRVKAAAKSEPPPPPTDDSYVQQRLYRTRLQINAVCDQIDDADDPTELTKLTQALERLQDIEADLDARPVRPRGKDVVKPTSLPHVHANLPPGRRKPAKQVAQNQDVTPTPPTSVPPQI